MVVPSKISDTVLAYACKYRSKGRIPALSYLHWANHVSPKGHVRSADRCASHADASRGAVILIGRQASITRCSQPLVGLKNNRSGQDERLIEAIFSSHVSPETAYAPPVGEYGAGFGSSSSSSTGNAMIQTSASGSSAGAQGGPSSSGTSTVYGATATNLIVDARPTANAMANVATGAGTENMENYKMARKTYLGIENIHVMRKSLKEVDTALQRAENTGTMIDRHLLRRSNWLKHLSAILDGVLIIVRNVHINSSHVMIHCSDGWDRTSQLSALAQVCLDPYFRTIRGFQVLIEKDWVSFGHKFMDRCGHLSPDKLDLTSSSKQDEEEEDRHDAAKAAQAFFGAFQKQFTPSSHHVKETSPVFHQFLDCVRQLHRQYPERFEYNSQYLEDIYYHLYSCQFGTFVANTERQRRMPGGIDDDGASLLVASKPPICERSVSIWEYMNQPEQLDKYRNSAYDSSLDNASLTGADGDMGVLLPNPRDVRFWAELFKRGDDEMNGAKQVLQEQAQGVDVVGPISTSESDPVIDHNPATVAKAAAILGTGGQTSSEDLTDPVGSRGGSNPITRSESPARRDTADSWHNVEATNIPSGPNRKRAEPAYGSYGSSGSQSPNRAKSGGSSSWGWSNFSTGALTVLQGAAKELSGAAKDIRTIGSDAYTNFAAPAPERSARNPTFDAWDRPSAYGREATGRPGASNLHTNGGWLNGLEGRQPSRTVVDANPWAATDTPVDNPTIATIPRSDVSVQSAIPPRAGLPETVSYMRTPSETWGSVADRKHQQNHVPLSSTASNPHPQPIEARLESLSLGTTRKGKQPLGEQPETKQSSSWDPLGAM